MQDERRVCAETAPDARERLLIVVPTLNEERHIGPLLETVLAQLTDPDALVVVADGGSKDRTRDIVARHALADRRVHLLDNELRLQSAGVNKAVALYGEGRDVLIRIDAHGAYGADFIPQLLHEARQRDADSIVVRMISVGQTCLQKAVAAAQNSILGNGGSAHRSMGEGRWVEHGHHALMRIGAFRKVGGYDPTFSHNEDAEFDVRLARNGGRIWLTAATSMIYFPRPTLASLFRQYANYGRGRARTLLKSGMRPRLRQAAMVMIFPMVALALLTPMSIWFSAPAALWAFLCLGAGFYIGWTQGSSCAWLAGIPAMTMHLAWSFGFWQFQIGRLRGSASP